MLPEAQESTARGPDALSGRVLWVQRKADENKAAVCTRPSSRKLESLTLAVLPGVWGHMGRSDTGSGGASSDAYFGKLHSAGEFPCTLPNVLLHTCLRKLVQLRSSWFVEAESRGPSRTKPGSKGMDAEDVAVADRGSRLAPGSVWLELKDTQ